jgi:DNA repair protein RadC
MSQEIYHPTMKEMPSTERPRERLRRYGPAALSTAELLAIILRTGTHGQNVLAMATSLLARYGGLAGLARAHVTDLQKEKGVGLAKACDLKAALELGRRLLVEQPEERPSVSSPQDIANLLGTELGLLDHEEVRVLALDSRNRVLTMHTVSKGSANTAALRVGEIFREAIRHNAVAVVVVHNHPSGDPTPSAEDIRITQDMIAAGRVLDTEVLDHIILAHGRLVSLRERHLGFP